MPVDQFLRTHFGGKLCAGKRGGDYIHIRASDVERFTSAVDPLREQLHADYEAVFGEQVRFALSRLDAGEMTLRPFVEWLPDSYFSYQQHQRIDRATTPHWAGLLKADFTESPDYIAYWSLYDATRTSVLSEYWSIVDAYQ